MIYVLQILGAVVGALFEVALVPGLSWAWFGHKNDKAAPGCFTPGAGINSWELLFWELVLTFVLVRSPACESLTYGVPCSTIPHFHSIVFPFCDCSMQRDFRT